LGYPPFIKMIIDNGNSISKDYWKGYILKFVFAGEVFSEEWRSLLAGRSYVQELERDIVSIYGTADAGVLATETEYPP
jgi:phenylacetate-CoA ligase